MREKCTAFKSTLGHSAASDSCDAAAGSNDSQQQPASPGSTVRVTVTTEAFQQRSEHRGLKVRLSTFNSSGHRRGAGPAGTTAPSAPWPRAGGMLDSIQQQQTTHRHSHTILEQTHREQPSLPPPLTAAALSRRLGGSALQTADCLPLLSCGCGQWRQTGCQREVNTDRRSVDRS